MWWGKGSLQKYKRISGWKLSDGTVKCLDCGGDKYDSKHLPKHKMIHWRVNFTVYKLFLN